MNEEEKMDKTIERIKKHFNIKNEKDWDMWAIKMFMNMPISDLKNRLDTMPKQWGTMTDTQKHIMTIAKEVYDYRVKMLK